MRVTGLRTGTTCIAYNEHKDCSKQSGILPWRGDVSGDVGGFVAKGNANLAIGD